MPRGDGTGPRGEGPGTGRGLGRCRAGTGTERSGTEQSQSAEKTIGTGFETGSRCVCPTCGTKATPLSGVNCGEIKCPNCGAIMVREDEKIPGKK